MQMRLTKATRQDSGWIVKKTEFAIFSSPPDLAGRSLPETEALTSEDVSIPDFRETPDDTVASTQTIPIFFSFNDDYTIPAAVAFFSLLDRAKAGVRYQMYVLHSDIREENQSLLKSVVARFTNGELEFIHTADFLKKEWGNGTFSGSHAGARFTMNTIIRCFCARFFPRYDKIIYSDVDVVFADDVSELWEVDLTGKYLAAVRGAFLKYSAAELSHFSPEYHDKFKDTYFGAGLWVLNLKKIREDSLEDRLLEIIRDPAIVKRWPDQDIMNIACDNHVAYLPLNYVAYPYMLSLLQLPAFESHYSREELWDSFIHPKIIHYAAVKPWKAATRYSDLWYDIFFYLGLDPAFLKGREEPENRYLKKYKKYRRRFFVVLFSALFLILLLLALLFYLWRIK